MKQKSKRKIWGIQFLKFPMQFEDIATFDDIDTRNILVKNFQYGASSCIVYNHSLTEFNRRFHRWPI